MNTTIRTVIIEDEKKGRIILENMLTNYCNGIEVAGTARNVEEGVEIIKSCKPDLVFLDIEMPGENGFHLFYYFTEVDFAVIFTTAYSQYAIKALRMSALDYLLKPIDLQELKSAVERYRQFSGGIEFTERSALLQAELKGENQRLALPTQEGFVFVDLDDLVRLQAENNYTLFIKNNNEKILVSRTLKEYEQLLSSNRNFLRVHRSHFINIKYVTKVIKRKLPVLEMEDGYRISVPITRKQYVISMLIKE